MPNTLLSTKLYIPPAPPKLVLRPRLTKRLDEATSTPCRLTLLSAPAGFGKTTLLSEWIHQTQRPVAWISLDKGDNDPARFFAYLIAALLVMGLVLFQGWYGGEMVYSQGAGVAATGKGTEPAPNGKQRLDKVTRTGD